MACDSDNKATKLLSLGGDMPIQESVKYIQIPNYDLDHVIKSVYHDMIELNLPL